MAKANINSKKGFTIIEVVLVLAIAGLIFLMVFVALPALQRSQRDTARRNDMSRVDTSLVQYQTNNSSKTDNLPQPGQWLGKKDFNNDNDCAATDTACMFVRDYMNSGASGTQKANEFMDPDGEPYSLVITDNYSDGTLTGPLNVSEITENKLEVKGAGYSIGGDSPFSKHVVYIIPGAKCDGEIAIKDTARHFAVLYRLEGAGTYCIDDQ